MMEEAPGNQHTCVGSQGLFSKYNMTFLEQPRPRQIKLNRNKENHKLKIESSRSYTEVYHLRDETKALQMFEQRNGQMGRK